MAGLAWGGGRGLPRVVTGAPRPSRPRTRRGLLARASASSAPMGGEAEPGREGKAHATLRLRRGCGQKTLCYQWMRDTRRGGWGPRRTVVREGAVENIRHVSAGRHAGRPAARCTQASGSVSSLIQHAPLRRDLAYERVLSLQGLHGLLSGVFTRRSSGKGCGRSRRDTRR